MSDNNVAFESAVRSNLNDSYNNDAVYGNLEYPPYSATHSTTGGAPKKKVNICGRDRVVTKEGRYSYVTIQGDKVSMSKAREMDKQYKQQKKQTRKH